MILTDYPTRTIDEIDMPFGGSRITGSVDVELAVRPATCVSPYGCGEIVGHRVVGHGLYIGPLSDADDIGLPLPPWDDIEPELRREIEKRYVYPLEAA